MKCTVFLILAASITVYMQCMPGDPQKVLVTSNDSRVRVYDNLDLVAKSKGTLHLAYLFVSQGFGLCYLVQFSPTKVSLNYIRSGIALLNLCLMHSFLIFFHSRFTKREEPNLLVLFAIWRLHHQRE